ncbi:MAG: DUF4331 family protein [Armatimonadetes bacterium]|nr:DUF4331 family protein [Armatimonadota bacterium]
MKKSFVPILAVLGLVTAAGLLGVRQAIASDHADTPQIAQSPGTDLTDVYIFPSPNNPNNVVLVMNVNPLITPSTKNSTFLDPNVLYQFKIDNNLDGREDRVIQVWAEGTGSGQKIRVAGPSVPASVGTNNGKLKPYDVAGDFNSAFSPTNGMQVFAGVREDPFFFDLEQFFTIFPDRATPITGVPVDNPNDPQATTWRAPGTAVDFLSNGNYSVISIVVELPKTMVTN